MQALIASEVTTLMKMMKCLSQFYTHPNNNLISSSQRNHGPNPLRRFTRTLQRPEVSTRNELQLHNAGIGNVLFHILKELSRLAGAIIPYPCKSITGHFHAPIKRRRRSYHSCSGVQVL